MDQAVQRALSLLEALSTSGPLRVTRIAETVQLSKSTVHRQLQTLIELGYVEREPETNRYAASLKLWELGSAIVVEHPIKRVATPFLHDLRKDSGHTVSLLVPSGDDVLYLEKLNSPRAPHFRTRPGSRVAAPLTAGGQAILAYDPQAEVRLRRVAARQPAEAPLDAGEMLEELARVRSRGFAVNRRNPEVVSIACALLGKDGTAAAAISASSPADVMNEREQARMAQAVVATCARIADLVGRV